MFDHDLFNLIPCFDISEFFPFVKPFLANPTYPCHSLKIGAFKM